MRSKLKVDSQKLKVKKGQSVVELIFAIAVIVLVITGVVALMVNNIGTKNKGFDRKKATEIAQMVIENLIQVKKTDPIAFWSLDINQIGLPSSCSSTPGYACLVNFTVDNSSNNCTGAEVKCVNVAVNVSWNNSADQSVTFNRFFSKAGE